MLAGRAPQAARDTIVGHSENLKLLYWHFSQVFLRLKRALSIKLFAIPRQLTRIGKSQNANSDNEGLKSVHDSF